MKKYERNIRAEAFPEAKQGARSPYGFDDEFTVTYTPIKAGVFNIYLFGAIENANQFISAIEVLCAAGENDVVIINLSTCGGSLDATDTFIQAMRECEARIIVKATGGVHSAGTVILLNSDEFMLSENFNALIHNGYCGTYDKFSDWKAHSKHTEAYMERVMRRTYYGFLTEEEINELLAGKDFWLDGEEFSNRWEKRNEFLLAQMEKEDKEIVALLSADATPAATPAKVPRKKKKTKVAVIPAED